MHSRTVEIRNLTRGPLPRIPFEKIARKLLGGGYSLSLVLSSDAFAERINRTHRKKKYPANVLSFPLDRDEGEMFLNLSAAKREAKQFGVSYQSRLILLFTHGCLHLKGLRHGRRMDALEKKVVGMFT